MTLGEELRRKYGLTSFKARGECLSLIAINEALESAAEIADQEQSPMVANRIRRLKWIDRTVFLQLPDPCSDSFKKPAKRPPD